ncbi:hypothetical protein HHL24_35435 [Paraburkholderia sp. RP-4-7]|uniref:Uncharacterized protein n=1 Tax=Paraburkholderia polaris TaxID=2728848 RepID=A0A848IT79_9BURK|nr:hypothetical protein [Paraburkholderia polaris]NMM03185.1 hypothetical protein [Paraburkholderia polaris]
MHSDLHAAMLIVNTETHRTISRLDRETLIRIAMRARNEGRVDALLSANDAQLRKMTAVPDPQAPLTSWDVELSVNGHPVIALSETSMAAVANVKEFAPIVRTIAQRTFDVVGYGPNESGTPVAIGATPFAGFSAPDLQRLQDAAKFLAMHPDYEACAKLIESLIP